MLKTDGNVKGFIFWGRKTNLIYELWNASGFSWLVCACAWLRLKMENWEKQQHTCSLADLQRRGPRFAAAQGAGGGTTAGKQSVPLPYQVRANAHPSLPHRRLCPSPGDGERCFLRKLYRNRTFPLEQPASKAAQPVRLKTTYLCLL